MLRLKLQTVSNETATTNNPNFARTLSLSSRTELCVCFLACCLTCVAGVTRAHQFSPLSTAVWSWGSKERHVVSKQQDGCQVTDTEVLRAERACLAFLRRQETNRTASQTADRDSFVSSVKLNSPLRSDPTCEGQTGSDHLLRMVPTGSKMQQTSSEPSIDRPAWGTVSADNERCLQPPMMLCSDLTPATHTATCATEFDIITVGNDKTKRLETCLSPFYRKSFCCQQIFN